MESLKFVYTSLKILENGKSWLHIYFLIHFYQHALTLTYGILYLSWFLWGCFHALNFFYSNCILHYFVWLFALHILHGGFDCEYGHVSWYYNFINVFELSWNFALNSPGKSWNLICQNRHEPWRWARNSHSLSHLTHYTPHYYTPNEGVYLLCPTVFLLDGATLVQRITKIT